MFGDFFAALYLDSVNSNFTKLLPDNVDINIYFKLFSYCCVAEPEFDELAYVADYLQFLGSKKITS